MTPAVVRLVTVDDVPELTRLVVASREHLRPWEPRRPERFWTEAGQREMVELALVEQAGDRTAPYVRIDGRYQDHHLHELLAPDLRDDDDPPR